MMPNTNIENPYDRETQRDHKVDKAKKKLHHKKRFKNNIPINREKLQWLKGEGPQTD